MSAHSENPLPELPLGLSRGARLPRGLLREIREAQKLARDFNEQVAQPRAREIDRRVQSEPDYLPLDLVREAGERGFFTRWLPKAFGGGGLSPLSMLAFSEVLAEECLGIANLIGSHYVGLTLVSSTFNFKKLQLLCREVKAGERGGEPCLVSTAITEPDAGTDLEDSELIGRARVRCRAERVPGGYRLRGTKIFISNAHFSQWHVVTAYSELARPADSAVVLLVRAGSPGFALGRIERKMGQHASPASVLHFDDCFVPDELVCLARSEGEGAGDYRAILSMLSDDVLAMSRPGVAAMAAGAARGAWREAMDYCLATRLGDTALANQEWAQAVLAEMDKNVKLSQLCAWEAALCVSLEGPFRALFSRVVFTVLRWLPGSWAERWLGPALTRPEGLARLRAGRARLADEGADSAYSAASSLAKFAASDLAMENCRLALQLMGQSGFRAEGGAEKRLRDVKLLQIYEGTNQLNRLNLFKKGAAPMHPGISVFNE